MTAEDARKLSQEASFIQGFLTEKAYPIIKLATAFGKFETSFEVPVHLQQEVMRRLVNDGYSTALESNGEVFVIW